MTTPAENHTYNVFIDLDKTLLSVDSGTILAWKAYQKGMMRHRDLLKGIFLSVMYRLNWRDTRKIINSMVLWLKGISEADFAAFAEGIAREFLIPRIRPEMQAEIAHHKSRGGRIILLSASLDYVCIPVGGTAGFDELICSQIEVRDGLFTGHPKGRLCFRGEKLRRIQSHYEQFPGTARNDYYYADSIADLPVLKHVGNPVCVGPDRRLRVIARHRNWRVME